MSPHFGVRGMASATVNVATERGWVDGWAGAEKREREHARRGDRGHVSGTYGLAAFGAGRRGVSR
jgi:hypothetical protein